MLYCVNMASYRAISPLCPAAAQARASKTGIAYKDKEQQSGSDLTRQYTTLKEKQRCQQPLTTSFSWLWPEWSACLTLWESKISWRNRCFPKATAPLVTIIISRPWFCSIETCKYRKLEIGPGIWSVQATQFWLLYAHQLLLTQAFWLLCGCKKAKQSHLTILLYTFLATWEPCQGLHAICNFSQTFFAQFQLLWQKHAWIHPFSKLPLYSDLEF